MVFKGLSMKQILEGESPTLLKNFIFLGNVRLLQGSGDTFSNDDFFTMFFMNGIKAFPRMCFRDFHQLISFY